MCSVQYEQCSASQLLTHTIPNEILSGPLWAASQVSWRTESRITVKLHLTPTPSLERHREQKTDNTTPVSIQPSFRTYLSPYQLGNTHKHKEACADPQTNTQESLKHIKET